MRIDPGKLAEARRALQSAIRYLRRLENPNSDPDNDDFKRARLRLSEAAVALDAAARGNVIGLR